MIKEIILIKNEIIFFNNALERNRIRVMRTALYNFACVNHPLKKKKKISFHFFPFYHLSIVHIYYYYY